MFEIFVFQKVFHFLFMLYVCKIFLYDFYYFCSNSLYTHFELVESIGNAFKQFYDLACCFYGINVKHKYIFFVLC
jgi:hypothetical protein